MFRRVVGVELDGRSLQAVCLRWEWKRPVLEDVLCLDLPHEADSEDAWNDARQILSGWRTSLKRPARVTAALPGPDGFPALLHFPFRRLSLVRKVIKLEMEGNIPLVIKDAVVDFLPSPQSRGQGRDVWAVAVPKAALARHLDLLGRLDILPEKVVFSPFAFLGLLGASRPGGEEGLLGLVHVGSGYVSFLATENGRPVYMRSFRRTSPVSPGGEAPDAGAAFLVRELQLSLRGLRESSNPNLRVVQLMLSGQGDFGALAPRLEVALGIPCAAVSWSSSEFLRAENVFPPEAGWRISAALGAGLSALAPFGGRFNLRREEFALMKDWRELKLPAAAAAAALFLAVGAAAADLAVKVRVEEGRLLKTEARARAMFTKVFPDAKRIVDPLGRFTARVQERARSLTALVGIFPGGDGSLDIVAKISRAIPPSLPVRLNRLEVDGSGVFFDGVTTSFEGVDQIKTRLGQEAGFERPEVKQARLVQGKQEVLFSIRIYFAGGDRRP